MQLTEVISHPARSVDAIPKDATGTDDLRKNRPKLAYGARGSRENPAFCSKDEV